MDYNALPASERSTSYTWALFIIPSFLLGFPFGSAGKESACNAGDLGLTPVLEKEKATHSSILA